MNVQDYTLSVGTRVTIKALKIQPKMYPNYNGIFTVQSLTPNKNYWLENEKGLTLRQSYPRNRLKIVNPLVVNVEEDSCSVLEIKRHKIKDGKIQYFVLWSNNDGTWQNEEDLEPELMEKYWSDKGEIPTEKEVGEIAPKPTKLANYRPNHGDRNQSKKDQIGK